MSRRLPTLLATCAAVTAVACGVASADGPRSRGDLMKACMAEWKLKSTQPGGEKLKYTTFLSECLKRMSAVPTPPHR